MSFKLSGSGGVDAEVSGTGFRALRIENRPLEYGANGSYRKALLSGTMAAGLAANSEVFQFRWTHATKLAVIHGISVDCLSIGTAFTAGFGKVDLVPARSWTVDGSGGTVGTLTSNNAKLRTSMATSQLGAVRIASTAALTAGTKTLDAEAIGQISLAFAATANVQALSTPAWLLNEDLGGHPLVLVTNEGFVVRATVPATGTWQFGVTARWTEVDAW